MADTLLPPPLVLVAAYRHGDAGDERAVGQVVVVEQVATERLGAGGQHDVVDRGAECLLDHLEVLEGGPREGHGAVRGQAAGELRARGGQRERGVVVGRAQRADDADGGLGRAVGRPDHPARPGQRALERLGDQLGVARHRLALPRLARLLDRRGVGLEVDEVDEELGPRDAVDRRVVQLGHERHVAVLEALDDGELPQRSAAVERDAGDVADELTQLAEGAGRGRGDAADVAVEVEVLVLDPHRVVEPERARRPLGGGTGPAGAAGPGTPGRPARTSSRRASSTGRSRSRRGCACASSATPCRGRTRRCR